MTANVILTAGAFGAATSGTPADQAVMYRPAGGADRKAAPPQPLKHSFFP